MNPNHVSLLSVLASLLVLFTSEPLYLAIIVLAVLYLDALDGRIARKHGISPESGHMTDVSCDRFSELVIFLFNPLLLMLAYVNIILTVLNLRRGTWILPLRHVYLIYLIYIILA